MDVFRLLGVIAFEPDGTVVGGEPEVPTAGHILPQGNGTFLPGPGIQVPACLHLAVKGDVTLAGGSGQIPAGFHIALEDDAVVPGAGLEIPAGLHIAAHGHTAVVGLENGIAAGFQFPFHQHIAAARLHSGVTGLRFHLPVDGHIAILVLDGCSRTALDIPGYDEIAVLLVIQGDAAARRGIAVLAEALLGCQFDETVGSGQVAAVGQRRPGFHLQVPSSGHCLFVGHAAAGSQFHTLSARHGTLVT